MTEVCLCCHGGTVLTGENRRNGRARNLFWCHFVQPTSHTDCWGRRRPSALDAADWILTFFIQIINETPEVTTISWWNFLKYLEEFLEVTDSIISRYLKVVQVLASIYFFVSQVIVKGRYNSKWNRLSAAVSNSNTLFPEFEMHERA
jgi:hypothetical protein